MSITPSMAPVPETPPVIHHTTCRDCGGRLDTIVDLGIHQLNTFPETPDGVIGPAAPLVLKECFDCGLFQLADTVSPELLYREYWYRSGVNEMMRKNLASVVTQAMHMVNIRGEDLVLDIGANDGTLLGFYREYAVPARRVAVEPALNVREALQENALPHVTYNDFFPLPDGRFGHENAFKVITSIAMFYDLEDPNAFVKEIKRILAPDGVWILEVGYFPWMLKRGVFDMICHEHLEYYTLDYLQELFARYDLKIARACLNDTNGQSLRLVVAHAYLANHDAEDLSVLMDAEDKLVRDARLDRFRQKVESLKRRIVELVYEARELDWTIDLYGASTKGNTLLQYCGLGYPEIRQALERSPEKIGRYTVGTGIPIVSDDQGADCFAMDAKGEHLADLWLCPIWQFKPAILEREREYLARGGRILFPMPEPEIVKLDGTS